MTMTETQAFEAMLGHHRELAESLGQRVLELRDAVAEGRPHQVAVNELSTYLTREVLPHARAEEGTVYPAAARKPELAQTVEAMTAEHGRLAELAGELAGAAGGPEAVAVASTIEPLFSSHVQKENELLLPRLRSDGELVALLGHMHGLLDGAGRDGAEEVLDVRELGPAHRHQAIFARYAGLAAGAGFVLVNDHDPKPLRYQFEAEHTGAYTWDYLEAGPRVWRVRIGRPAAGGR